MKPVSEIQKSLIKVGKVVEAHSLKGEVKVFLLSGEASWLSKVKKVFLSDERSQSPKTPNLKMSPQPEMKSFTVEKTRMANDRAILKFKGINDRTQAEALKGLEVWIDESLFTSKQGEAIFLREILGFEVFSGGKSVGVVSGFDSNNSQDLLIVECLPNDSGVDRGVESSDGSRGQPKKQLALIPLIKEFLVSIDYQNKHIHMNLPEGLLEANHAL